MPTKPIQKERVRRAASPRGAEARYRIRDGVAHREIEGQTLVLASAENRLYTLNATGQFIWRRLSRPRSIDDIVRAVAREFGVPIPSARTDVDLFLASLLRRRLLKRE